MPGATSQASDYTVGSHLQPWAELEDAYDWSGILVGNGASRSVWDDFTYTSLYRKAASDEVEHPLSDTDRALFRAMKTKNFEHVLRALFTAETVGKALKLSTSPVLERYESIQRALGEAVNAVHIPWQETLQNVRQKIRRALCQLTLVYSTNYDLLVYWSIMAENPAGQFADFFWTKAGGQLIFDVTNTEIWEGNRPITRIFYLHGGLHLYRRSTGETLKRAAEESRNLLDLFGAPYENALPLFITEGSSKNKLESIHSSDYLAFAYSQFVQHEGDLIVFGHALAETDAHIVDAMRSWGERHIAIPLRRGGEAAIVEKKAILAKNLPKAKLHFFDAETHPLGEPALRVTPGSPTLA